MATGVLLTPPIVQFFGNDGKPAVNGSVLTQVGAVNTATYQDIGLTVPLPNPIPLNSRGEISTSAGASAQCFLTPNVVYTFTLFDLNSNPLWVATYVNGVQTALTQTLIGTALYPQTPAEAAVLLTPTNYYYPPGDIRRYGADTTGVLGSSTAIQAAISANLYVLVPDGTYLIDADLVIRTNGMIWFNGGAIFKASANNRTFFKSTVNAYYSQVWNAVLDGNAKTNVTGFDLTNVRLKSGLFNPSVRNLAIGYIFRGGCFGLEVLNPDAVNVPLVVQIIGNCAVLDIHNPTFDNEVVDGGTGLGIGIDIQGSGLVNSGVHVVGGFVQGFAIGIQDAALGTKVDATYFEGNTTTDISGVGARGATYADCQHGATLGPSAYKLRNSDAISIYNPKMGGGNRTVLYDVDNTNTNCNEYRPGSNSSYYAPTGSLVNLSNIPRQTTTIFTPIIAGSTTAGAGTYAIQSGTAVQTGTQVHIQIEVTWTAHTGTGSILINGIPNTLTPVSFTPKRIGMLSTTVPVTNTSIYAQLTGTNAQLNTVQVSAAGAEANIPIAASGALRINMTYDL